LAYGFEFHGLVVRGLGAINAPRPWTASPPSAYKEIEMAIAEFLAEIQNDQYVLFPKNRFTREKVIGAYKQSPEESANAWLLPCRHVLHQPAPEEQINNLEDQLRYTLPSHLREFLSLTNGAELYKVSVPGIPDWIRKNDPDPGYIRYHLYSVDELLTKNREALKIFRDFAVSDPIYEDVYNLNYVAFSYAYDGNQLGILLHGDEKGKVFLLDHEYEFFPYDDSTIEAYETIAPSLEDWFALVAQSHGWRGFGDYNLSL
jgi:hypothetical protein